MYIIFEMIHYFRNSTIDNQIGKSNTNARKDELKQTIKEINIGNQTVSHNIANQMAPHKKSFAGNESVVKRGIKKHQNARNLSIQGSYYVLIVLLAPKLCLKVSFFVNKE